MAGGIVDVEPDRSSRRRRPPSDGSGGGPMAGLSWVAVALGATAIVARLGSRKTGALTPALTALAGVAAVAAVRGVQHDGRRTDRKEQSGATNHEPETERSIEIGKTADELRHHWLDPRTLPRVMAGFATVRAIGAGRVHWKIEGPLGRTYEWDTEAVNRPGEGVGWRSLPGAQIPNEGSVRFRPAPADRGSVATLHFRFDPPGGLLGEATAKLLAGKGLGLAVDGVLRRFKSLVETGEIPTTERQPAARADPR